MNEPFNIKGAEYKVVGVPVDIAYAAIYRNGQFVGWAKKYSSSVNATVEKDGKSFTTKNYSTWNPVLEEIEDFITKQGSYV